jgi:hypothetical protein
MAYTQEQIDQAIDKAYLQALLDMKKILKGSIKETEKSKSNYQDQGAYEYIIEIQKASLDLVCLRISEVETNQIIARAKETPKN